MMLWKMVFQLMNMPLKKRPADYDEQLAAAKAAAAFEMPDPPAIAERATGHSMLHHCEMMIPDWGITRGESDEWAAESQRRAAAAQSRGDFARDIIPFAGLDRDPGIRETSVEKLAGLNPIEKGGIITAGTATGLNDGVSMMLLARSDVAAKVLGRKPTVFPVDSTFDGIDPKNGLLMGPAKSFAKIMERNGLTYDDLAVIEGHEAFAAQILCVDRALEKGFEAEGVKAIGKLPRHKVNPNGGSLALGHPFSATGGRIMTNLARQLQEKADATKTSALGAWFACAAGAMSAAGLMLAKPSN